MLASSPATIDEITEFEKKLSIKLPVTYIEFLKLYNGGSPEPSFYEGVNGFGANVGLIFDISSDIVYQVFNDLSSSIPTGFLPIGLTGGGDYYLLQLSSGAIYFYDHELDENWELKPLKFLEPNIDCFLGQLKDL